MKLAFVSCAWVFTSFCIVSVFISVLEADSKTEGDKIQPSVQVTTETSQHIDETVTKLEVDLKDIEKSASDDVQHLSEKLEAIVPDTNSSPNQDDGPIATDNAKESPPNRSTQKIATASTFPSPESFFLNYVSKGRPLYLEGVARRSPSIKTWTAQFLSSVPHAFTTWLRTNSLDNLVGDTKEMKLSDFMNNLTKNNRILYDDVPNFLQKDILFPSSLQCNAVLKHLRFHRLVIAGKPTTLSVLPHTDIDALACLKAGQAKVSLWKEPKDAQVKAGVTQVKASELGEALTASMVPGDCIFMPEKWLFQWQYHSRVILVSFTWQSNLRPITREQCGFHEPMTALSAYTDQFVGTREQRNSDFDAMIHYFMFYLGENMKSTFSKPQFNRKLKRDQVLMKSLVTWTDELEDIATELFEALDRNKDGKFSHADIKDLNLGEVDELSGLVKDRISDISDVLNDQQATKLKKKLTGQTSPMEEFADEAHSMFFEDIDKAEKESPLQSKRKRDQPQKTKKTEQAEQEVGDLDQYKLVEDVEIEINADEEDLPNGVPVPSGNKQPTSAEQPNKKAPAEKLGKGKPTEEPEKENVVKEPKKEKVVNEPKKEKVVNEPKKENAVNEPKKEKVVNEPKKEKVVNEPKKEKVVNEPKKEKVDNEPKKEKVVNEPKTEESVTEPQKEDPVDLSELLGKMSGGNPQELMANLQNALASGELLNGETLQKVSGLLDEKTLSGLQGLLDQVQGSSGVGGLINEKTLSSLKGLLNEKTLKAASGLLDEKTLSGLKGLINEKTLSSIEGLLGGKDMSGIGSLLNEQTLSGLGNLLDSSNLKGMSGLLNENTLSAVKGLVNEKTISAVKGLVNEKTLAGLSGLFDGKSLSGLGNLLDEKTLSGLGDLLDDKTMGGMKELFSEKTLSGMKDIFNEKMFTDFISEIEHGSGKEGSPSMAAGGPQDDSAIKAENQGPKSGTMETRVGNDEESPAAKSESKVSAKDEL